MKLDILGTEMTEENKKFAISGKMEIVKMVTPAHFFMRRQGRQGPVIIKKDAIIRTQIVLFFTK